MRDFFVIAYLIWKGSYNDPVNHKWENTVIAYLIWKGSYNFDNPSS